MTAATVARGTLLARLCAGACLGLVGLPLATSACRRSVSPAVEREQKELHRLYGKDARLILKAPACSTAVAVPTTRWKPALAQEHPLGFTLPAGFHPDTAPHFIHGGYRWTDGDREFDIIHGDWRPRAFIQEPSDGCRTIVGGHPVLVVRAMDSANRLTLTVWPYEAVPPAGSYGVLVEAVSPDLQDDPLLLTMATGAVQAILGKQPPAPSASTTPAR